MIELINLKKAYTGRTVLSIDNLTIKEKEFIGLVGNNGAGKTTMLSLILDLIKPSGGVVTSKQKLVSESDDWKTYTGSFLGEGFLIPFLTPMEFLEFIGGLHGKKSSDAMDFLSESAGFFTEEINHKKYIRDHSAGNKNKLGILAAIFTDPEVLILDEPFSNLDPSSQAWLKSKLKNLNEGGVTILISSHDLKHVTDICGRIVLLEKGVIIKDCKTNVETLPELEQYFNV